MTTPDVLIITSTRSTVADAVADLLARSDAHHYRRLIADYGAVQVARADLGMLAEDLRPQDGRHANRDAAFRHAREAGDLFVHEVRAQDLLNHYIRMGWAQLTDEELAARASAALGTTVTVQTVDATAIRPSHDEYAFEVDPDARSLTAAEERHLLAIAEALDPDPDGEQA